MEPPGPLWARGLSSVVIVLLSTALVASAQGTAVCPFNCETTGCRTDGTCSACASGFYSQEPICKRCQSPKECVCSTTCIGPACPAGGCTACVGEGFYLTPSGSCAKCQAECTGKCTDREGCAGCAAGSYLVTSSGQPATCGACGSNCTECKSNTECTTCKEGFYRVTSGNQVSCSACGSNCTECTSNTVCTKCKAGFRAVVSGADTKCDPCSTGCNDCPSAAGTCRACKDGYFLQPSSSTCALCSTKCKVCATATTCNTCEDGFFPNATAGPNLGKCVSCSTNCKTCATQTTCGTCNNGFWPSTTAGTGLGKCIACSAGCESCSQSNGTCTKCRDGFKLDGGACKACSISRCIKCDEDPVAKCDKCASTHYVGKARVNGQEQCLALPAFCADAVDRVGCYRCLADPPRYPARNGLSCITFHAQCEPDFRDTTWGCLKCKPGFGVRQLDGTCVACGGGCEGGFCSPYFGCTKCRSGFRLANSTCVSCPGNCTKCDSGTSACDECRTGFARIVSETGVSCVPCAAGCDKCSALGKCDPTGCRTGFLYVADNQTCARCDATMPRCTSCSSTTQCNTCAANNFMGPGGASCVFCNNCEANSCHATRGCTNCMAGRFPSLGACAPCSTANCQGACSPTSGCSACPTGRVLSDNMCKLCSTHCATCTKSGPGKCDSGGCRTGAVQIAGNQCSLCAANCNACFIPLTCETCAANYYPNPSRTQCLLCSTANCDGTCSPSSGCSQCLDGFILKDKRCQACSDNCVNCDIAGVGKCDICKPGYAVDATTKRCGPCKVANCGTCPSPSSIKCDACLTGFQLFHWMASLPFNGGGQTEGYQCEPCPADCIGACDANGLCITACEPGYFLRDGVCVACSTNCMDDVCDPAVGCTECYQDKAPVNGVCNACGTGCKFCKTRSSCDVCLPGYKLSRKVNSDATFTYQCVRGTFCDRNCDGAASSCDAQLKCTKCKAGFYPTSSGICMPCDDCKAGMCDPVSGCAECKFGGADGFCDTNWGQWLETSVLGPAPQVSITDPESTDPQQRVLKFTSPGAYPESTDPQQRVLKFTSPGAYSGSLDIAPGDNKATGSIVPELSGAGKLDITFLTTSRGIKVSGPGGQMTFYEPADGKLRVTYDIPYTGFGTVEVPVEPELESVGGVLAVARALGDKALRDHFCIPKAVDEACAALGLAGKAGAALMSSAVRKQVLSIAAAILIETGGTAAPVMGIGIAAWGVVGVACTVIEAAKVVLRIPVCEESPCDEPQSANGAQGFDVRTILVGTGSSVAFEYDAKSVPDEFTVQDADTNIKLFSRIAGDPGCITPQGPPQGSVIISKPFDSTRLTVIVNAPCANTAWGYIMGCAFGPRSASRPARVPKEFQVSLSKLPKLVENITRAAKGKA